MTPDIKEIPLTHRSPYRFIDGIVQYEEGRGITCEICVRGDEPYFDGHFPGHPIVPGVLEMEMLFQAAELFLITEKTVESAEAIRLSSVGSARFMKPVVPPRDLTVVVDLKERRGSETVFSGRVCDGSDTFVQASFSVQTV